MPQYAERIAELAERLRRVEELVERQRKELEIQFQRIAQLQAQLDERQVLSEHVREFADLLGKDKSDG